MMPPGGMDMGASINGKWMNKLTGEIINVRDNIIDGDQMILITDKGQLSMNEFSRNYIQASEEIYDEHGTVIGKEAIDTDEIVHNANNIVDNDNEFHTIDVTTISEPPIIDHTRRLDLNFNTNQFSTSNISNAYLLIDKIFKKKNLSPKITINIECDNFPSDELNMIIDYFDVSNKDVSDWMQQNFVSKKDIDNSISEFLDSKLKSKTKDKNNTEPIARNGKKLQK